MRCGEDGTIPSEGERQRGNNLTAILLSTSKQSSIPLDRHHIEELIDRLDRDRTGMVDYRWARPLAVCEYSQVSPHKCFPELRLVRALLAKH